MNDKPFVDFMIVGAMKSGTTTLSDILKSHNKVSFCSLKEPQFFSESPNWREALSQYKNLFPEVNNDKIVGEASTGYTMFPEFNKKVWEDIYAFNPKMKIIYIMRDPVARIVSHYKHSYTRGYTRRSFDKAILEEPVFINRTRYYTQIKPYLEVFGKNQVLLITFEKFLNEKEEILHKVADFLGIENNFNNYQEIHSNKAIDDINIMLNRYVKQKIKNPYLKRVMNAIYKRIYSIESIPPKVTDKMEEVIWRMLEQDIDHIEKEMGRSLSEWPSYKNFKFDTKF